MPVVFFKRQPPGGFVYGQAEGVAGFQCRLFRYLPVVEAVHEVRGINRHEGAWNGAVREAEVMHSTGVVVPLAAYQYDGGAIEVEGGSVQQGKPSLPGMGATGGLHFHRMAAQFLQQSGELDQALPFGPQVKGEMQIHR